MGLNTLGVFGNDVIPDLRNRDVKIMGESRSPTVSDLQDFVIWADLNIAFLPKHIDELRLRLTKKAISKTRNTGTLEQHQSGTQNTGTLKILNLLKIREKILGGVELLLE